MTKTETAVAVALGLLGGVIVIGLVSWGLGKVGAGHLVALPTKAAA